MTNLSDRPRRIAVYPYFPIGYMSWMNQGAEYRADLGGVVGSCVTPYQKATEYFKNKYFKDKTYFLCETPPVSWDARQQAFEGEGGLHAPSSVVETETLSGSDARYEATTAAVAVPRGIRGRRPARVALHVRAGLRRRRDPPRAHQVPQPGGLRQGGTRVRGIRGPRRRRASYLDTGPGSG